MKARCLSKGTLPSLGSSKARGGCRCTELTILASREHSLCKSRPSTCHTQEKQECAHRLRNKLTISCSPQLAPTPKPLRPPPPPKAATFFSGLAGAGTPPSPRTPPSSFLWPCQTLQYLRPHLPARPLWWTRASACNYVLYRCTMLFACEALLGQEVDLTVSLWLPSWPCTTKHAKPPSAILTAGSLQLAGHGLLGVLQHGLAQQGA